MLWKGNFWKFELCNSLGTWGTKKSLYPFPKKKNYWTPHDECMLSLLIGYMKFLFQENFVTIFGMRCFPSSNLLLLLLFAMNQFDSPIIQKNDAIETSQNRRFYFEELSFSHRPTYIGVATPLWAKCEGEAHTPKSGKLESFGTPENSKHNFRGQISSHLSDFDVIGKVLKCRCPKWPHMSHLNIWSPSYGQKKGWESNWQFDSRPLKVGNWPVPDVHSRSATWRWKALFKGYNFGSDLVPIRGWGEELWSPKVPRLQPGTVSGLHFGSPGKKSHSNATPVGERREYYREYGGGISRVRAVVCLMSPS